MRFLFVIDSFGPGGAQRQMLSLTRGLIPRGHEIEFFIYYPDHIELQGDLADLQVPIHSYRKRHRFSIKVAYELRRVALRGNYDVVLAFLRTPSFYAELAKLTGLKTPVLISERYCYPGGRLTFLDRCREELHRLADWIVVNSHHQREWMEKRSPWIRQKISTIYNGVDLDRFRFSRLKPPSFSDDLRFLAVGRVEWRKNPLGLVRALKIYRERYGKPPLIRWVGSRSGPSSETTCREVNRELAEAGLVDHWEWLGVRQDVPELLRDHDALIHPSLYEGLPNVVCEALAAGRPALVGDVCDHSRLVKEGVTGNLFDPTSPESTARAINRYADTSWKERNRMGCRARQFAEESLSLENCATRYESLLLKSARLPMNRTASQTGVTLN